MLSVVLTFVHTYNVLGSRVDTGNVVFPTTSAVISPGTIAFVVCVCWPAGLTRLACWVQQDLEDRYNRLRLEVQLAADKGEAVSEAELVRRTMAKEKTALTGKGFFGAPRYASQTVMRGCLVLVVCLVVACSADCALWLAYLTSGSLDHTMHPSSSMGVCVSRGWLCLSGLGNR